MTKKSTLESYMLAQIKGLLLPDPIREYKFLEHRRYKFDFAWPDLMIALEVEGGTWVGGGHSRGLGYEKDCEKYNHAAINGWRIIRVTTNMVHDGRALTFIETILESAMSKPSK